MKKIILLIGICGMMEGVRGQASKNAISSLICPGDMWITLDQYFFVGLDDTGTFYDDCIGMPSPGGENVIHFTIPCANTYTIEYETNEDISISYRLYNPDFCDSSGYICLNPVYLGNDVYQIDLALDSAISYDLLFENNDTIPAGARLIIKIPHVSNFQLYNITPDSITASWDGGGTVDEMIIEYGPKGFIPGSDAIPGVNGTVIQNPTSPFTFTGLIPDSVYDFYFRDKYCGVFSPNSNVFRKRIPNCSNLTPLNCNANFSYLFSPDTSFDENSWTLNGCGVLVHTSREKIFEFTADTTGIYSFHHGSSGLVGLEFGIYIKESTLVCNETNWTCIGAGANNVSWDVNFGPLPAGTTYHIMFKTNHFSASLIWGSFRLNCPSPLCSSAPDSITSNATNNTICLGQSVTLTQVGGVLSSNGTFLWYADSCDGTAIGNGYSATFSPAVTTTYYVRAEDTCGVTSCASITINVNPSPAPPTITGDTTICQGTSTILTASAGYACYLWSMASTTQSVTVSNTGVYMVTVCDANGCTASASIAVIVYPNPVPVITGNTTICQGSSTTLNAGAGYTSYLWSTAATTQTINVASAGVYAVTVTNAFACSASASVTVTVNPNPVPVITGNTTICQGGSTTLNAGAGYSCYIWSTGANTQTINAASAGTYTVTVCDANGCTGSGSKMVTVLPLPSAMISGNSSICSGDCASITVFFTGTPPFAYSYTDGVQTFGPIVTSVTPITINACPTFTTTYTLISVNDVNCAGIVSGSAMITVSPNPTAVITPSATTFICLGDTVHYTANTGAGFIYQWYKNTVPISGAVNSFYDAFASGDYSFAVTDSNGCSNLSSFTHVQIICFPPLEPSELRMAGESNDDIVLIPNPASHEITIQTGTALQSIKIFDVVGQLVYSIQPQTRTIKPETKIDISHFSKGIYFVIVNNGKENMVRKFVKE